VVNAIAQSRMAERYGGLFGYSAGPQPMMRGSSGRFRNIVLIIVPIALILGTVFWFARSCSSPPRPPIIQPTSQDTGPMVPVFAIKGELRYHALGCPVISDVPTSSLTRFNSDKEAEAQNLVGCTYCQDLLRIQKENAATQPAGTPTPKP